MRTAIFIPAFLLAVLSFPGAVRSQITQDWAEVFPAQSAINPQITTDGSGNIYVAGNAAYPGYILLKYNSAGALQWGLSGPSGSSKTGGIGIVGVGTDNAGNVYLVTNAAAGIFAAAFNSSGTQLWSITLPLTGLSPTAWVMTTDGSGNVYIGGQIYTSTSIPSYSFMTIKITGGVEQWLSTFRGTGDTYNEVKGIKADASGNVYVTGTSGGAHIYINGRFGAITRDVSYDITTIKYGPSGNAIWTNTYNAGYDWQDYAFSLAVDPTSGNVYALGQSANTSTFVLVGDVIAYSSAGSQLWLANNSISQNNTAIAVDPSGNVLTGGEFIPNNNGFNISKYASTGSLTWSYSNTAFPIEGTPIGFSFSMALDKQGNCYVTGPQTGTNNYTTAEVSSGGVLAWSIAYAAGGGAGPSGIAIFTPASRFGGIIYPQINVTGTTGNSANFATVQYQYHPENTNASYNPENLTGLDNALATVLAPRLSNFPNPFRGATTITYTIPNDSHVAIQVFDQSGHTITALFDGKQNAGSYTVPFAASGLAPGIYHYRIVATSPQGSFVQTKQMLIL